MASYRQIFLLAACLICPPMLAFAIFGLGPPLPGAFDITGVMGNIGEWEVTAALARNGDTREYNGPMKVTHIGWCSQDGPLEKTGELQIKMARLSSSIAAKVRMDGIECHYTASLSDAYIGLIACPDRRPVQLLLWIR